MSLNVKSKTKFAKSLPCKVIWCFFSGIITAQYVPQFSLTLKAKHNRDQCCYSQFTMLFILSILDLLNVYVPMLDQYSELSFFAKSAFRKIFQTFVCNNCSGKVGKFKQAMVEMDSILAAQRAKAALNGADIYRDCCTIKVLFNSFLEIYLKLFPKGRIRKTHYVECLQKRR